MAIAPNDANILYPGGPSGGATGNGACWIVSGSSATCCCPTYFEVWLSMGSGASATLNFSSPPAVGGSGPSQVTAATYLKVIVDGGVPTYTAINSTTSLSLIGSASAGTHAIRVEICQCNTNQWSNSLATQVLNWTSITTTATTVPITTAQPNCMLVLGDSIASGSLILAPSTTPSQEFSLSAFRKVGRALECEVASGVYPGIGYLTGTRQGGGYWPVSGYEIPGFFTPGVPSDCSYNLICAGQTRTWPSNLRYVVLQPCVNDALSTLGPTIGAGGETSAQLSASCAGCYAAIRPLIPSSCRIIVVPTWAGAWNGNTIDSYAALFAAVQTGWQDYQTATPDPLCWFCPLGLTSVEQEQFYNTGGSATTYTSEGLHPLVAGHEILGAQLIQAISAAEGRYVAGSSTPYGRAA